MMELLGGDYDYTQKRIFEELKNSEGDKWMRERVSLTGIHLSVMSSSHRNIRFGRTRLIQRVHLALRWALYLFIYRNPETVPPICFSCDLSRGILHTD